MVEKARVVIFSNIQKNEIVRPITSAAGSEIGDVVGKGLYDFIEKKLKSIDNKVQVEEKDGSGKKASPDQDPEEKEKIVKKKSSLSKAESQKVSKKNSKKESSEKRAKKQELRTKYGGDEGTCFRDSCKIKSKVELTFDKSIISIPNKIKLNYKITPSNKIEFTLDPLQYILMDSDINQNGKMNDENFENGVIAATLTTLDQGTEEVLKYGIGKESRWYKYHTYKMLIITNVIDYNLNLQEQRIVCPACDDKINHLVAGVQTAIGYGASATGGLAAVVATFGIGAPISTVAGAVAASTAYSEFANKQIGEVARPIVQYIVSKYNKLKEK